MLPKSADSWAVASDSEVPRPDYRTDRNVEVRIELRKGPRSGSIESSWLNVE